MLLFVMPDSIYFSVVLLLQFTVVLWLKSFTSSKLQVLSINQTTRLKCEVSLSIQHNLIS